MFLATSNKLIMTHYELLIHFLRLVSVINLIVTLANPEQIKELAGFRLKTPKNQSLIHLLIRYFTSASGIDLLKFDQDEIEVVVPKIFSKTFRKLSTLGNTTLENIEWDDIFERPEFKHYNGNIFPKKELKWYDLSGVKRLMNAKNKQEFRLDFNKRPSYNRITNYLRWLAKAHPNKMKLKRIGKTAENQYIFLVNLTPQDVKETIGIFLDSGIHGRDWTGVITALYIIQELTQNSHSYPDINYLTWYIMPVVNPDGYRYSYRNPKKNTGYKNRHCTHKCKIGECGVDISQNFPWNRYESNSNECSPFYAGTHVFSETESTVLAQALIHNREYIKLYLELTGNGGYILYSGPYTQRPFKNQNDLEELAKVATAAMGEINNNDDKRYITGNYRTVTYLNAGGSLEYVRRHFNIKYAYIFQIRNLDVISKNQSYPLVREAFAGIRSMAYYIYSKHPPLKTNIRLRNRNRKLSAQRNCCYQIRMSQILFMFYIMDTGGYINKLYIQ